MDLIGSLIVGVFALPVLLVLFAAVYFPIGIISILCEDYDKTLGPYRPWQRLEGRHE